MTHDLKKGTRIFCDAGHHVLTVNRDLNVGDTIAMDDITWSDDQESNAAKWRASERFAAFYNKCGSRFAYAQDSDSLDTLVFKNRQAPLQ